MSDHVGITRRRFGPVAICLLFGSLCSSVAATLAVAAPFNMGDLFVTVYDSQGHGLVQHYDASGNLLETLDTLAFDAYDCTFDESGRLYVTSFSRGVVRFDGPGDPHTVSTFAPSDVVGFGIELDGSGNVYVGLAGLKKLDATGNVIATFAVPNPQCTPWAELCGGFPEIALAGKCIMSHTFEGSTVAKFNVCNNTPLADSVTGLRQATGLRLLPGCEVLVTDLDDNEHLGREDIKRFDATGHLIQTYDVSTGDRWAALALDPTGTSFWAANVPIQRFQCDPTPHTLYKFNVASGAVELGPISTGTVFVGQPPTCQEPLFVSGLCVFGESLRPSCGGLRATIARVLHMVDPCRVIPCSSFRGILHLPTPASDNSSIQ